MYYIGKFLRNTVYLMFILLFTVLFFNVIFNNMHFDYSWYFVLPTSALWFLVLYRSGNRLYIMKNCLIKNEKKFLILFFVVLGITQIFFFTQLASYPTRDLENVFRSAYYYAIQGAVDPLNTDYLYKHPNNLPWVITFQFIFRLVRKTGAEAYIIYVIIASLVNGIAISVAYMFTYLCCKKIMGVPSAFFALVLLYTCLPLQFNISFFYTDTLTMAFIPFALYFYLYYRESAVKKSVPMLLLFSFVVAYGIHLKYSVIIIMIAIVIDMILNLDLKKMIFMLVSVFAAFIIWQNVFDSFTYSNILDKNLAEDAKTPFSSYIMMGLNGDGSFNVDDRYFAWSFDTKEEKEDHIREQIIYRLSQHTLGTMLQHLNQKGVRSFGSGNMEYNYTISNSPVRQTFLVNCVSPGTPHFTVMGYIVQGWHVMLFLLVIAGRIIALKNSDFRVFLPILSVLGLYLFLLLWESSQRYLINYMCMYIVSAIYTLNHIYSNKCPR